MAIERDAIVTGIDRLLRQGRLEDAIAEYVRLVNARPRDWNARNALGDLFVRQGETAQAVAQFLIVADHLAGEGFLPRAGALYKKVLKIDAACDAALERLAELAGRQRLTGDAKAYVRRLAALRHERRDVRGVEDCALLLADIDPADGDTLRAAVRIAVGRGEPTRAAGWLEAAATVADSQGRAADAMEARLKAAEILPDDRDVRARAIEACLAAGDRERALPLLDVDACADDPDLLLGLAHRELSTDREGAGMAALTRLLAVDASRRDSVAELALELAAAGMVQHGFACLEAAVDAAVLGGEWSAAAGLLERFASATGHAPATGRLAVVRREGGLEAPPVEREGTGAASPDAGDDVEESGEGEGEVELGPELASLLRLGDSSTTTGDEAADDLLVLDVDDVDLSETLAEVMEATATVETGAEETAGDPEAEPVQDLDTVFAGFRQQAAADDVNAGTGEATYEEALRHLEAGDLEAGARALRAAARDPLTRFAAGTRLGRLLADRGDHAEAVEWFERALEAPSATPGDRHRVLYALAESLDRSGEPARALAVFIELEADAGPEYGDVGERLEALRRSAGGTRA